VKFIADGMLGKLTRWLRMLGQDVKYSTQFEDFELIATAEKEHRVLLTRDSQLYERAIAKNVRAFYVRSQTGAEKLAELAKFFDFSLAIDLNLSRCPRCNSRIYLMPKETLAGSVEKNTFTYHDEFWKCSKCGQVYWKGAHWNGIHATLAEAKKMKDTRFSFI
jgi:uncharacterized protein with PIN domain